MSGYCNEKHERLFPFSIIVACLHTFSVVCQNHAVVLIHDSLVRMRMSKS